MICLVSSSAMIIHTQGNHHNHLVLQRVLRVIEGIGTVLYKVKDHILDKIFYIHDICLLNKVASKIAPLNN